jgi:hypothetical protein
MLRLYRVALTGREDRWVSIAGMSGKWKIKADKDCLIVNSPTAPQGWVSITGMVGQYHRNTHKSAEAFEIFIDSIAARINPDKVFMSGSPELHNGLFDAVLKTLAAHGVLHFKIVPK